MKLGAQDTAANPELLKAEGRVGLPKETVFREEKESAQTSGDTRDGHWLRKRKQCRRKSEGWKESQRFPERGIRCAGYYRSGQARIELCPSDEVAQKSAARVTSSQSVPMERRV